MELPIKLTKAPDFHLPDQNGVLRSLSDFIGKWILLYFYPKDDTPGCTKEACGFRDVAGEYNKEGIVIIGISKDDVPSHKKFADKYHLLFPLLSDESKETIKSYDAWGEKKFMGRVYDGVKRVSFLIDPQQMIRKSYLNVNPFTHASSVLLDYLSMNK